jgi:hypothetical protein
VQSIDNWTGLEDSDKLTRNIQFKESTDASIGGDEPSSSSGDDDDTGETVVEVESRQYRQLLERATSSSRVIDGRNMDGLIEGALDSQNRDLAEHLMKFEDPVALPPQALDFSMPHRYTKAYTNPRNEMFLSKYDPEKYRFDEQV